MEEEHQKEIEAIRERQEREKEARRQLEIERQRQKKQVKCIPAISLLYILR